MSTDVVTSKENTVVINDAPNVNIVNSSSKPSVIVQEVQKTNIVESKKKETGIVSGCQIITKTGGSGTSGIFAIDITNAGDGLVGNKSYVPDTIPADAVISEALTDDDTVTIHFLAEGGSFYSPTVTVDGIQCANLQQYDNDRRLFYGSVNVSVPETRTILLHSSAGSTSTVIVNRAEAAPEILSCLIGDYPSGQTAVKAGDTVSISGTVEDTATHVRVNGGNALDTTGWVLVSNGTFTITGTVSSNSGEQSTTVVAKNDIGSVGSTFTSENTILLDQTVPTFSVIGTTFPAGQFAFKGTETGAQSITVQNADSVFYSSPNGDFTITDPTVYQESKDIQCTNPGTYNDSTANYRIVAGRSSNGTTSTINQVIEVADSAPTVSVTQTTARLVSSPSGYTHTITATSDQNLSSSPSLSIPVSGSWSSSFSGSGKVYTADLVITDGDAAGTAAWVFDSTPTNNAGLSASITGLQTVGGFAARDITLQAFADTVTTNALFSDVSKVSLVWSFKEGMTFKSVGTAPPVVLGWTVDALDTSPTTIIILDTSAAASSSQASTLTIEETP